MNKRSFAVVVAGAALLSAGIGTYATAASVQIPYRSYPGVACQPFQSKADGFRDVDGSIRNRSTTQTGDYLCPVRHDGLYSANKSVDAYVQVIDTHNDKSVTCHMYTYTKDRTPYGWMMKSTSKAGFSSSPQTLHFPTVPAPRYGHIVVRCSVPPSQNGNDSRVVSYHVAD